MNNFKEEVIYNNKEIFIKDIITRTGINSLKSLDLVKIEESRECNKIFIFKSNYLDNSIGVLANNFTEVYLRIKIYVTNEESVPVIFVFGDFNYKHKVLGSNGINIMEKDIPRELRLQYKYENDQLILTDNLFAEGFKKIIVHCEEVADKVIIAYDSNRLEWDLVDVLKDAEKNKISINEVEFYIINNDKFTKYTPDKEDNLYKIVKNVVYKKQISYLDNY